MGTVAGNNLQSQLSIAVLVDKDVPTDHSFIQGVLEKTLPKYNCHVTFIGYPSGAAPVQEENVSFININNPPSGFFARKINKIKLFTQKIKESGPYDVLYTRNDPVFLIIGWYLKRKKSVKLHFHQISHLHAFSSNKDSLMFRVKAFGDIFLRKLFLKYADRILVISEQMKTFLEEKWPVYKQKYIVFPLGIEVTDFKEITPYVTRKYDVAYIGTLANSRRVDVILDAIKIYNDKYGLLDLHIWGGSHNKVDDDNLKDYAVKLGIKERVHFYGKISRHEVLEKLKNTKIGLSTIPSEGILNQISPTKLMEYMAAGCCVVATQGIKDQEEIFSEAYHKEPIKFDAVEIADELHKLLSDTVVAEALSEKGRKYIFGKRAYSQMGMRLKEEMVSLIK